MTNTKWRDIRLSNDRDAKRSVAARFYRLVLFVFISIGILIHQPTTTTASSDPATDVVINGLAAFDDCRCVYGDSDSKIGTYFEDWTPQVTFTASEPVEPGIEWLMDNLYSIPYPFAFNFADKWVIGFWDPSLTTDEVDVPYNVRTLPGYNLPAEDIRAAYLITDTLWGLWAIDPYIPMLAAGMRETLIDLGWYGNGLHEVIFHSVAGAGAALPFRNSKDDGARGDRMHGEWLADCNYWNEKQIYLHVFKMVPGYEGFEDLFTEMAVFQAFHEWWNGNHSAAISRIKAAVRNDGGNDVMFWDDVRGGVVVDNYAMTVDDQWNRWVNYPRQFSNSTFKTALLVYALRFMNIIADDNWCGKGAAGCDTIEWQMLLRLAEAQIQADDDTLGQRRLDDFSDEGGYAHAVIYGRNASGDLSIIEKSGATGETTASVVLAHTVNPSN